MANLPDNDSMKDLLRNDNSQSLSSLSEEVMKSLIGHSPNIITIIDRNYKIQFLNRTNPKNLAEEVIGKSVFDFIEPEFHELAKEHFKKVISTGEHSIMELRSINLRGQIKWYENRLGPIYQDNQIVAVSVFATDITAKKQYSEKLSQSFDYLSTIMESIFDPFIVIDLEFNVICSNAAARERKKNYNPKTEKIKCHQLSHHSETPCNGFKTPCPVIEVIKIKKAVTVIHEHFDSEENSVWMKITASPVLNKNGDVKHIIEYCTDITEQVDYENSLMESEEKYRSFLQHFQGIAFRLDTKFIPFFVHGLVEKITGYTESEFLAGNPRWGQIIYPNDFVKALAQVKPIMSVPGYTVDREYRIIRKDGETRCINERLENICDDMGKPLYFQGVIFDITEKKKAERALKESEDKFRILIEQSPLSIEIYNPEGYQISVNSAWEKMWNAKAEDAVGKFNILNDQQVKEMSFYEDILKAFAGEDVFIDEWSFNPSISGFPGHARYMRSHIYPIKNARGDILNVVLIHEDITDMKEAEKALKFSEEQFSKAFHGGPLVMTISAIEDGSFIEVNDNFIRISGYTKDEIIGKTSVDLGFFARETQERIIEILFSEGKVDAMELEFTKKSGDKLHCLYFSELISIAGEQRLLSIVEDVTLRKQAEKELEQHQEHLEVLVKERTKALEDAQVELIKQERMATLGHLVAIVGHEIRNPLGTIRASLYTIQERLKNSEHDLQPQLDRAARSIERCDMIIEELLDFKSEKPLVKTSVVIDKLIDEILDDQNIPAEINLLRNFNAGTKLSMDSERIRRCIVNILTNARQAVVERASKTILQELYMPEITINTVVVDNELIITVIDNGVGISPDELTRIFEPLFSTKNFGVGLGLSIVKQIVEQHDGSIKLESEPGKGTSVIMSIPT